MIPRKKSAATDLRALLAAVDVTSPRIVFARLESLGYRGQAAARRSAALFAYRHIRRLQRIHVEGLPRESLPPKWNMLMIGPTGCGKTFLTELLFAEIFPLPHVVMDVSRLTESGYIGADATSILTRLLINADMDLAAAQIGVVVLDEIDKIALESSSARFAGQGTTKDVKGNVQKELLQIVSGGAIACSSSLTDGTYAPQILMDTHDIGFIACGAFSGFKDIAVRERGPVVGFRASNDAAADTIAYELDERDVLDVELFQSYGFLPEFIGRFGQICRLHPLSRSDLRGILLDNVLPPLRREFELEGVPLELTDSQLDAFVEQAIERRTGARGLRAAVEQAVEKQAFERFGGV